MFIGHLLWYQAGSDLKLRGKNKQDYRVILLLNRTTGARSYIQEGMKQGVGDPAGGIARVVGCPCRVAGGLQRHLDHKSPPSQEFCIWPGWFPRPASFSLEPDFL